MPDQVAHPDFQGSYSMKAVPPKIAPVILEVLRRFRLRLEAETPPSAQQIQTVKALMFMNELTTVVRDPA